MTVKLSSKVSSIAFYNKQNFLQLAEVQVMNNSGQNIALSGSVQAPQQWPPAQAKNAISGVLSQKSFPQISHNANGTIGNGYWILTLKTPDYISSITIYNRLDCCQYRLATATMVLKDINGNVLFNTPLTSAGAQTFTFLNPMNASSIGSYQYQGCYNDTGNRAIPNYLGNVSTRQQCEQMAQSQGYNVFGLQYYGQCFAGNSLNQAKKYGPNNGNCGNMGTGWTNQVYANQPPQNIGEYTYKGCYNDTPNRAIPKWPKNVNTLQQCAEVAKQNNANVFGVQDGFACFIGNDVNAAFKYGGNNNYDACNYNGQTLGGPWTNQVYSLPAYDNCNYQMSPSELKCYKNRYPDLPYVTDKDLQAHWSSFGCKEKRNNQCASPQKSSGLYEYKGCFNDKAIRAIPNYQGVVKSVDQCASIAEKQKQTVFGLQDGGKCYTGNNVNSAYQYGTNVNRDQCGPMGKSMTNEVYVRSKAYPPPTPTVPKLQTSNFSEGFQNKVLNSGFNQMYNEIFCNLFPLNNGFNTCTNCDYGFAPINPYSNAGISIKNNFITMPYSSPNPDTFTINIYYISEYSCKINATRTDMNSGWNLFLQIKIFSMDKQSNYIADFGSSNTNNVTKTFNTNPVQLLPNGNPTAADGSNISGQSTQNGEQNCLIDCKNDPLCTSYSYDFSKKTNNCTKYNTFPVNINHNVQNINSGYSLNKYSYDYNNLSDSQKENIQKKCGNQYLNNTYTSNIPVDITSCLTVNNNSQNSQGPSSTSKSFNNDVKSAEGDIKSIYNDIKSFLDRKKDSNIFNNLNQSDIFDRITKFDIDPKCLFDAYKANNLNPTIINNNIYENVSSYTNPLKDPVIDNYEQTYNTYINKQTQNSNINNTESTTDIDYKKYNNTVSENNINLENKLSSSIDKINQDTINYSNDILDKLGIHEKFTNNNEIIYSNSIKFLIFIIILVLLIIILFYIFKK